MKNGLVTLTGDIGSNDEKARISENLANIDGVQTVINFLTISRAVQAAPAKAAMLVAGTLSRFGRMERNVLSGVAVAVPRADTPDLLLISCAASRQGEDWAGGIKGDVHRGLSVYLPAQQSWACTRA